MVNPVHIKFTQKRLKKGCPLPSCSFKIPFTYVNGNIKRFVWGIEHKSSGIRAGRHLGSMGVLWSFYKQDYIDCRDYYRRRLALAVDTNKHIQFIATWFTHGLHMVYTWFTHGLHMVYTWFTYGLHMVYTWFTHGLHKVYT